MGVKYFLRTTKNKGKANLYFQLNKPRLGLRLSAINTLVSVDIEKWNKSITSVKNKDAYRKSEGGKQAYTLLERVENAVNLLLNSGVSVDKAKIDEAIHKAVYADAVKQQQEANKLLQEQEEQRNKQILVFVGKYIEGIKDGSILTKSQKRYTADSVRIYENFADILNSFMSEIHKKEMTFCEINERFANRFDAYLSKRGLMGNTKNKYTNCMRRVCRYAADKGLFIENAPLNVWHTHEVGGQHDKRATPYLERHEIDALYEMPLDGELEKVRDVFFFDLFAAQRVSDFEKFNSDNFTMINGMLFLSLTQKKTGANVLIPIVDNRVKTICEKYNYNLPVFTAHALNRYCKMILQQLSESVPSLRMPVVTALTQRERDSERYYADLLKRRENGEKLCENDRKALGKKKRLAKANNAAPMQLYARNHNGEVIKPKWEMIASHTCRRTWVTLEMSDGVLTQKEMMSVTGHKNARVFECYDKRRQQTVAVGVAEKLIGKKNASKAKVVELRKAE